MEKPFQKIKICDFVSEYIRDKIISGELKSGDRIIETAVAKSVGVSQAPVREALRELEVMGLVKLVPYKGCYVLPINKNKLQQVYGLRTVLECFAVEQGIENMSNEAISKMEKYVEIMNVAAKEGDSSKFVKNDVNFHREIVKSANNVMLEKMWNLVGACHWASITISAHYDLDFFAKSHAILLAIVKKRDKKAVIKELKHHFDTAKSFVLKSMVEEIFM
jgi:DNA-binding GntR family transcriptional regulator